MTWKDGKAPMNLIVLKFGGTSLGSVERIKTAAKRAAEARASGYFPVVVVSAMDRSTDRLVNLAHQISKRPDPREMDMLLATGEQVSMALFSMALQDRGVDAISLTGWQAGIITNRAHTQARIQHVKKERLLTHIERGKAVIVAGFQGVTVDGEITTIGRGGSDTTAVALAAALRARRCDIFTDVDGVFTADPRIVPHARPLASVSYDDMLELADLGANVLHPSAVAYAKAHRVPIIVRSSFSDAAGTVVQERTTHETRNLIKGMALTEDIVKVTVTGLERDKAVLEELSMLLSQSSISCCDLTVQKPGELSFFVSREKLTHVWELLQKSRKRIRYDRLLCDGQGLAKISLLGTARGSCNKITSTLAQCLNAETRIHYEVMTASERIVSCLVPQSAVTEVMQTLHSAFFLREKSGVGSQSRN